MNRPCLRRSHLGSQCLCSGGKQGTHSKMTAGDDTEGGEPLTHTNDFPFMTKSA